MSSRRKQARSVQAEARARQQARAKTTRRRALALAGAVSGTIFLAGLGYFATRPSTPSAKSAPSPATVNPDDPWYFARMSITVKNLSAAQVKSIFVPITQPQLLSGGGSELSFVQDHLSRELTARNFSRETTYSVDLFGQYFGVPLDFKIGSAYSNYISIAGEFLAASIRGLRENRLERLVFAKGDDFTGNPYGKMYIGESYSVIFSGKVTSEGNPSQSFSFEAPFYPGGSAAVTISRGGVTTGHNAIIFGAGSTSLDAAVSEQLHLATQASRLTYFERTRDAESYKIEEGFVHGASAILAAKLLSQLGFEEGKGLLEKDLSKTIRDPLYSLVQPSLEWLRRNGVQAGFDLYMENPAKFRAAILA